MNMYARILIPTALMFIVSSKFGDFQVICYTGKLYLVDITGKFCSGKSMAARYFKERFKFTVIDYEEEIEKIIKNNKLINSQL